MPEATELRWEASDGSSLVACVHGPRGASTLPVILLHGLSQQHHFWDPVISRLRAPLVAALDQRGHGDSRLEVEADYRIERCAADVLEFMDIAGWDRAVIVGHSWGASVALSTATTTRAVGIGLIDGGLWGPSGLGDRPSVRERLRPPALGIPPDELWEMISESSPFLDAESRSALSHTFEVDESGLMRTKIGVERHMRVLDGLLDYRPDGDLARLACPAWAVVCEPTPPGNRRRPGEQQDAWAQAKADALARASEVPGLLIHRWMGAVHDVPLQWPAMVAGFIDALHESVAAGDPGPMPWRRD